MTDIAINWDVYQGRADWSYTNGDITINQDLSTSVLLSLFTDRLSAPSFIPPDGSLDRRGWWGDTYSPDLWGSKLWQLERAKKLDDTTILLQARDYCKESLQWLIDDGVVSSVVVNTGWASANSAGANLDIEIILQQPSKVLPQKYNFQWAWDGIPIPPVGPLVTIPTIPITSIPNSDVLGLIVLGIGSLGIEGLSELVDEQGNVVLDRLGQPIYGR